MTRLRDLTIRRKLHALTLGSVAGISAVLGLSLWVLYEFRVNGPVYEQISNRRAYLGEIDPGALNGTAAFLTLTLMAATTDATDVQQLTAEFNRRERRFEQEVEFWVPRMHPGPTKTVMTDKLIPAVREFFAAARQHYLPLVGKAPPEQLRRALIERVRPTFDAQARAVEQAIETGRRRIREDEDDATARIRFWETTMTVLSVATVLVLALAGWLVTREVVRPTHALIDRVRGMAGGASDLTARVPVESHDEMGQLAEGINATIDKIQTIVRRVRESSVQLLSTASEIGAAARQQETTVQVLSSSTAEVAASVREITATSKELAATMTEVSERSGRAVNLADAGRSRLGDTETAMKDLVEATASVSGKLGVIREKADAITTVVTTITKVADQTNLLSINAAIEAEKAGEYGRGFLVVAREIRRLADQTAVATLDIDNMVRHMQGAVSAGVMQMDKFTEAVRSGVARIAEVNGQTGQIIEEVHALGERFAQLTEGVRQQSLGAQQIDEAMAQVNRGAQQTRASLEEFKSATEHLRQSVELLNEEVAQFKV